MLSLGLGLIVFEVARRKRVEAVICQARIRNVAIVNRDCVYTYSIGKRLSAIRVLTEPPPHFNTHSGDTR